MNHDPKTEIPKSPKTEIPKPKTEIPKYSRAGAPHVIAAGLHTRTLPPHLPAHPGCMPFLEPPGLHPCLLPQLAFTIGAVYDSSTSWLPKTLNPKL